MDSTDKQQSRRHGAVFVAIRILIAITGAAACASDIAVAQLPDGLTKSRWAMDDPLYAEKYASGANKLNIAGKIKQASDARFVKETYGLYGSAGLSVLGDSRGMASVEFGFTGYLLSYLTSRVGFLGAINDEDEFAGWEVGMRLQTPTRLAPFAGAGLFGGYASHSELAHNDSEDNDGDGQIDELGEEEEKFDGALVAIYPETGIHFWWTPRVRLTGFGRYLVTTEGRDSDGWYYGGSISWFTR